MKELFLAISSYMASHFVALPIFIMPSYFGITVFFVLNNSYLASSYCESVFWGIFGVRGRGVSS